MDASHSPRRTRSQGAIDEYVAYSGLNFNTLGKCYLQSKKIVVDYGKEVKGVQGRLRWRDSKGVLQKSFDSDTKKTVQFKTNQNITYIIPCKEETDQLYLIT